MAALARSAVGSRHYVELTAQGDGIIVLDPDPLGGHLCSPGSGLLLQQDK